MINIVIILIITTIIKTLIMIVTMIQASVKRKAFLLSVPACLRAKGTM